MRVLAGPVLLSVLTWSALSAMGCEEDVAVRRPPRQPREVLVVAPVETVTVAPAPAVAVVPAATVTVAAAAPVTAPPPQVVVDRGAPPVAAPPDAGLETWASRHAEAAKALGTWVHNNPEAASMLFVFDSRKPGRSRELVRWAVHNPGEDITVFTSKHPDWVWFDRKMADHHLGAGQFLAWCRQYPAAAEELIQHPSGLRWVGDHVYAADWHPEGGSSG